MGNAMTIKTKMLAVLSAILVIFAMTIGTAVWSLQSQQAKIEVHEQGSTKAADPTVPLLIGLGALSGVVALAGSIFLFLTLARSFSALAGDVETVSGDDTARPFLLNPDRHDEFGPVATALRRFRDCKIEMARVRREQAEVERCAEEEKRRTMLKLAEAFEASVGIAVNQVSSAATGMPISSETMSAAAGGVVRQAPAKSVASGQRAGRGRLFLVHSALPRAEWEMQHGEFSVS
jgi:methyl-accepting chemotaxis protein